MLSRTLEVDETSLVLRSQNGDWEAFGALVRCHRPGVINVIYRMCGDAHLAEDAAQISLIRAWQHLPGFQPESSFRNWLYRIAVNAALDIIRKEKWSASIENLEAADQGDSLDTHVEKQKRIEQVRRAVLSLPEASRAALILREYEGLSYHEIAVTLEISPGTVMSRLNYARKRLAELLQDCMEDL